MPRKRKPNWWLLYLTVPLMLGLLVIESRMPYALVIHRIADFVIVLLGFGLMLLWVHVNEGGLIDEEMEKEPWTITSPASKTAMNPDRLPSDGCGESGNGHPHSEPSATKGRYN